MITLVGVAGTLLPEELHLFQSGWFMGVVALAFASLLVVVLDQCRQVGRLRPRTFAPFGGLFIHVGLLFVILAAVLKTLFGAEAVVDLMEGETLPPTSAVWAVQKPGWFAMPIRIQNPITLEEVDAWRYPAGDLQSLAVRLNFAATAGTSPRRLELPVNKSIRESDVRLFVGSDYGPTALIEWRSASGVTTHTAALLKHERGQRFEAELAGPDGARAYLRTEADPAGKRPAMVEVRVMKETALLFAGGVRIGEAVALPAGGTLALREMPFWVRLHASRDPSLGLIYLGFLLVIIGITLRYTLPPDPRPASVPAAVPAPGRNGMAQLSVPVMLLALVCVLGLTACNGVSRSKAHQLVERYNTVVSEAYRRGDVKLVDSVVGPNEGRKLTGLIGVRLDMGLTLDSKMLSLEVLESGQVKDTLQVRTRERWSYCDRRIGTGQQVGEKSEDSYEMRYFFRRFEGEWLVDRIEFATPPKFEHPPASWAVAHGNMPGHTAGKPGHKEVAVP